MFMQARAPMEGAWSMTPETESSSSKSGSLGFGPGPARLRLDINMKKGEAKNFIQTVTDNVGSRYV